MHIHNVFCLLLLLPLVESAISPAVASAVVAPAAVDGECDLRRFWADRCWTRVAPLAFPDAAARDDDDEGPPVGGLWLLARRFGELVVLCAGGRKEDYDENIVE